MSSRNWSEPISDPDSSIGTICWWAVTLMPPGQGKHSGVEYLLFKGFLGAILQAKKMSWSLYSSISIQGILAEANTRQRWRHLCAVYSLFPPQTWSGFQGTIFRYGYPSFWYQWRSKTLGNQLGIRPAHDSDTVAQNQSQEDDKRKSVCGYIVINLIFSLFGNYVTHSLEKYISWSNIWHMSKERFLWTHSIWIAAVLATKKGIDIQFNTGW